MIIQLIKNMNTISLAILQAGLEKECVLNWPNGPENQNHYQ